MLPKRAVEDLGHKVTRLPNLFSLNGFLCVSEKLAAVLRQFDLGGGGFHPVEILRRDGVTPVPGTYWALNFGAKKDALKADECQNIRPYPPTVSGQKRYQPWLILKDDDFVVSTVALEGADLWGDEHLARVGSTGQRNGLGKGISRCLEAKRFPGSGIEPKGDLIEVGLGVDG